MIRKTILALGVAALAPILGFSPAGTVAITAIGVTDGAMASANSLHNPYVYNTSSCYIVKRVVDTDFGPRVRRVTVCN